MKSFTPSKNIQPLSSIFLQELIFFDSVYSILFFFIEGCIFFYKGFGFFYPESTIEQDIVLLISFAICQIIRLQMGSVGNKTESYSHIAWFIAIIIPAAAGYFYFLFLQTYILMIELIMCIIGLVFIIFEIFSSLLTLCNFRNFEKQSYQ